MSPKQVKITSGCARHRDAVVDAAHRDHADRAAGPVHELDVRRQQVVDAVLVDRVRVPAAHLHDLVVAAGVDGRGDLGRRRRGRARRRGTRRRTSCRAPLRSRTSATPACTSTRSPGATSPTSWTSTVVSGSPGAASSRQRARPAPSSATMRRGRPWSPQVMQCSSAQAGANRVSARPLTRSRSPSAPRAPARTRRPCPAAARASRAPPPRRPSRARSRRG